VKAWPLKLRQLVVQGGREGRSPSELAREFEVPRETVKSWLLRDARLRTMQPGMQPASAKGKAAAMQPGMQPGMQPAKLATFRGVTALDLPGRTRMEKSLNFAALKQGTYPPMTWRIPGFLEGPELVKAIEAACEKWRKPKGGRLRGNDEVTLPGGAKE
jgi:hypothetical protein